MNKLETQKNHYLQKLWIALNKMALEDWKVMSEEDLNLWELVTKHSHIQEVLKKNR